jgi:predicted nucleic acid-binding protein
VPTQHLLVIDTNAALGWLVFRDPWSVVLEHRLQSGQAIWLACAPTVDELNHVLARPLAPRWEQTRERALTRWWIERAWMVDACEQSSPAGLVCRDPDDQKFLDLAFGHRAGWLLTSDRDLLALRRRAAVHGLSIGTPQQWVAAQPG